MADFSSFPYFSSSLDYVGRNLHVEPSHMFLDLFKSRK